MLKPQFRFVFYSLIAIGFLPMVGCAGFGTLRNDCSSEVGEGSIPEPAGTKLCQWQNEQIQQAKKDETTLYRADFIGSSDMLSPFGTDKVMNSYQNSSASWIVEPSGDQNLDAVRASGLTQLLTSWGASNPQVSIGKPAAIGMSGPFAEQVFGNQGTGAASRSSGRQNSRSQFGLFN